MYMSKSSAEAQMGFRLLMVLVLYAGILLGGTFGYHWIENWNLLDSFYMTVITITTVGFGEVQPLSPDGKAFTIGMALLGVGGFTYTFSTITDYLVKGEIRGYLRERRLRMEINSMQNHYVVCGFGRVGVRVAEELRSEGNQVLVVEQDEKACARAREKQYIVLEGNVNDEIILNKMGLQNAKGLIATLSTDEANLMLVVSARAINSELMIVARSNFEFNEKKLLIAGATRVISPYSIGGRRIAHLVTRPRVVEFLDIVMHSDEIELRMEDICVREKSELDGCEIGTGRIREKTGANIIGLRLKEGQYKVSPAPDTVLRADDVIVALGTKDQLHLLQDLNNS